MRVEARGLSHRYGRSAAVLENVDFDLRPGELVALTGASGAGKSTLLFVLGLLLRPTEGVLTVDGRDTRLMADAERARLRARAFGFLFQDAALDPTRSILDNVTEPGLYGPDRDRRALREPAIRLLERLGVAHRALARPGRVSGGQAQRIALCRALVYEPAVVIADEPTSGLDRESSAVVLDELRRRAQSGVGVIIATHDSRVIDLCDRVRAL